MTRHISAVLFLSAISLTLALAGCHGKDPGPYRGKEAQEFAKSFSHVSNSNRNWLVEMLAHKAVTLEGVDVLAANISNSELDADYPEAINAVTESFLKLPVTTSDETRRFLEQIPHSRINIVVSRIALAGRAKDEATYATLESFVDRSPLVPGGNDAFEAVNKGLACLEGRGANCPKNG